MCYVIIDLLRAKEFICCGKIYDNTKIGINLKAIKD